MPEDQRNRGSNCSAEYTQAVFQQTDEWEFVKFLLHRVRNEAEQAASIWPTEL